MNTLRNACSLILLSQHTDTKNVSLLTSLLDICLSRDCYLPRQKQLLLSWKHKLYSIWGPLPPAHQQSVSHKQNVFQTQNNPQLATSNPFQCGYGQHSKLPSDWAGWAQNLHQENKETLSVPTMSDNFQHRKPYPFLLQRKSAPNIETFSAFSSPVSHRKRYSFQDEGKISAMENQYSFGQHHSLPTIQPHNTKRTLVRTNQEHLPFTRTDCDWKCNENTSGFRSSEFLHDKQSFDCEYNGSSNPVGILVTSVESVDPPSDAELDTRLESLCLSVTEQALS